KASRLSFDSCEGLFRSSSKNRSTSKSPTRAPAWMAFVSASFMASGSRLVLLKADDTRLKLEDRMNRRWLLGFILLAAAPPALIKVSRTQTITRRSTLHFGTLKRHISLLLLRSRYLLYQTKRDQRSNLPNDNANHFCL